MSTTDVRPLLTTAEVGEMLSLRPRTIASLIVRGDLPAIRLGGQWRIDPDELEVALRQPRHRWEKP